jgi:hypothetical protein
MIFKIYNSDFGIKYNGVNYDFDHVDSLVIENPQMTKLVRGANVKNKVGLVYTEGLKEPKKLTVTLIGVSAEMYNLLSGIYDARGRCECFCVDRTDGSSKIAKNAILTQQPEQLTVDQSPESMNVQLIFETFDLVEVHKV